MGSATQISWSMSGSAARVEATRREKNVRREGLAIVAARLLAGADEGEMEGRGEQRGSDDAHKNMMWGPDLPTCRFNIHAL